LTTRSALARATRTLVDAGVPTPEVDAEWLLAHALGVTRTGLALAADRTLSDEEAGGFSALVERRAAREPLAYVLGEWGFRRLTLLTDRRALVPRPETEVVVERCLTLLRGRDRPRVLDVGTGSGAIALAIADEHAGAAVTGVDTSADALELACENARRLALPVDFRSGDLDAAAAGWDLVVSNPPYVDPENMHALEPEVRDWEPRGALVGDGIHERLAGIARTEWLVLEVGDAQAARVADALREQDYGDVRITRDVAGVERVVEGRRSP
jgi:release factor glutamine methyltransferase